MLGCCLRRRSRRLRLPHPQRPELGIGGHQLAQRGGPGSGQADDENRATHDFVVDLGMPPVGVLDLEALDQCVADGGVLDDSPMSLRSASVFNASTVRSRPSR